VLKFARPLFVGFVITVSCLTILELPFDSAVMGVLKRASSLVLAPGSFFVAAITRGMLDSTSYYIGAFANVAVYAALTLVVSKIWRRLRRKSQDS
jgi:hypothetical protein